jgi:hypothetical protein
MWKLIKAELIHGWERILAFTFIYLIFIGTALTWVRWERNRVSSILLFMFLMPLAAAYGGEKWRSEQKRDRLEVLLPVSVVRIGLSHVIWPLCLFVIMVGLYCVVIFIVPFLARDVVYGPGVLQLLTVSGLILIVSASGLLYRELKVACIKNYQRFFLQLFWWFIYIGALLPFYIVMNFAGWFGENTPLQNAIASLGTRPHILLLPGVGLSLLSLYMFARRKSYVES